MGDRTAPVDLKVTAGVEGYAAFYGDQLPGLVRRLRGIAGEDAEDVAQDALTEAFARWEVVCGLDAPEAWLWVVAKRIAMRRRERDRMRLARQERAVGRLIDELPEPIDALLGDLRDDESAALRLHHVEGWELAELCDLVGGFASGPGAAKVWLHRLRRRIAPDVLGLTGQWIGGVVWTTDAIVAEVRSLGLQRHEEVIQSLVPGGGIRRHISFEGDQFRLSMEDGCPLDAGRYQVRDGALVLDPNAVPGVVRLAARVDGDQLSLRFVDNTTPLWHGVDEWVYNRLLYNLDHFFWIGRQDGPAAI